MNRKRARRVTFRVGKAMMKLTRRLAAGMGSTLAELGQVMILIGAVCEFVQFENRKHFGGFCSLLGASVLLFSDGALSN
jgi:hypothetical protein